MNRKLRTNILLYGCDLDAAAKRPVAQALLEQAWRQPGHTAIRVQVVQEFHVNFVRMASFLSTLVATLEDITQNLPKWPKKSLSADFRAYRFL